MRNPCRQRPRVPSERHNLEPFAKRQQRRNEAVHVPPDPGRRRRECPPVDADAQR